MADINKILPAIIFAILSATIFILSIIYTPVTRDYSIENNQWNGLSSLVKILNKEYELIILNTSLSTINTDPRETCIIIISPTINYTSREIDVLKNFLSSGGTIIILEDFGNGNSILRSLRCPLTFTGKPLLDDVLYSKQPLFPTVVGVKIDGKMYSNMSLLLNIPTAINISGSGEWSIDILAASSEYSFIDENLNLRKDSDEEYHSYPVIVELKMKRGGRVIAISDPSILINSMINKYDNIKLLKMLLNKHGVKKIILDVAHREKSLLENVKYMFINVETILLSLMGDVLMQYILTIFILITTLSASYKLLEMIIHA